MYDMSVLHFYIERRNGVRGSSVLAECPVILSFSYSSIRIKTYTGRKIRQEEWDMLTERVKYAYSKSEEFNRYLEMLRLRVDRYFSLAIEAGKTPDPEEFKSAMKKMVKSEVPFFFDLLLRFIDENNENWSLSTFKKMKTFYSQLKDFAGSLEVILLPGMVNQVMAEKLVIFYMKKGLKDSSIKKNLDLLKWFMNWCSRKELIFNMDYQNIRFSPLKIEEHSFDIYLKWEEIINFYLFQGLTKKEEWCRDIFCFIAFTGIRFSKLNFYTKACIKEGYIQLADNEKEKVLLNRFSVELCKKYENRFYRNNTFFPAVSLITFHSHLRSAAQKAGLTRTIVTSAKISDSFPLHAVISAKSAINTFFAISTRLDIPGLQSKSGNSSRSRIIAHSGAIKLAEEKQVATTDKLYESITGCGHRP
jgi:hypothetical protein